MPDRPLALVLAALPDTVFAVVDGARLPGITPRLHAAGVSCRALFLGPTEGERQAGPQLAGPLDGAGRSAVLALCPDPTARVFWTMDDRPDAADRLSAHLRRMNAVRGPASAGLAVPEGSSEDGLLLLRHADALTLTLLAQVLTKAQATVFLGPATGILFDDVLTGGTVLWDAAAMAHLPESFAPVFPLRPRTP